MKLNEVFSPLFEETYKSLNGYGEYKDIVYDYFKKGDFIFRGMQNTGKVLLGDTSNLHRPRTYFDNIINTYTSSIDQRWAKFPKRDNSFICTNKPDYTGMFGKRYYVIPLEQQNLAVCPSFDFFTAFFIGVPSISQTVSRMGEFLEKQNLLLGFSSKDTVTPKGLKNLIDTIDANIDVFNDNSFLRWAGDAKLYEAIEKEGNLSKFLEKHYSPAGFTLSKLDNISYGDNNEIWFEGKALFVLEGTAPFHYK